MGGVADQPIVSETLAALIAAQRPRESAKPTGHMRERIAVALRGSRPNYFACDPDSAYSRFLREPEKMRAMYEQWADDFLRCCDAVMLEVVDVHNDREAASLHGKPNDDNP